MIKRYKPGDACRSSLTLIVPVNGSMRGSTLDDREMSHPSKEKNKNNMSIHDDQALQTRRCV